MHGAERGKIRTEWMWPQATSIPRDYLSLSGAKSQGIKQLMAGGGVALIGTTLIPLLSGLLG